MDKDLGITNTQTVKQKQLMGRKHTGMGENTDTNQVRDATKVTWEESAIEPHSTSNPEEDLTTYSDALSSGESELEDLLYHFNNFFASRLEQELTQFQSTLTCMLYEQQNHVRRIVTAVTDDCSQKCIDNTNFNAEEVVTDQTENRLVSEQEPMMTNQDAQKCTFSVLDGSLLKRESTLQLLTLSCAVSSVLGKPQFRK